MNRHYLLAIALLVGCNQQQTNSVAETIAKSYNTPYRESVIKNWQNKVSDDEHCASFKARFKAAGERHDSAAKGVFIRDMMKIWEEAKTASCEYSP